jgi:hypothetical protein
MSCPQRFGARPPSRRQLAQLLTASGIWWAVVAGVTAAEPASAPRLRVLHHAVVTDTIADAQSPCGLACDPVDGSLVLGFQDKGDVVAGTVTHFVRSHDGGQTWSPPFASYRHPEPSVGAAIGFIQLSPRQTVAVIMEITHTDVSVEGFKAPRKSRTLFARFDPHNAAITPIATLPQPAETLVGAMPQNLIQLRNGDLLLPAYLTPMDWDHPNPKLDYGSGLFRSRDGGQTWSPFTRIFGPHPTRPEIFYNESVIFEKADGTLVAFARYDNDTPPRERRMGKVVSRDGGQTWSATVDSDLAAICPAQLRLPGGGYLMFAGALDEPIPRTCLLYHSNDGETFTKLGPTFYSRTGGKPFNTATGGSQVLLPLEDRRFVLAFYGGDRDLPGRDKTYIDSNIIELR